MHDVHILQTTGPCNGGFPTTNRKVERKEEPECTNDNNIGAQRTNQDSSDYAQGNKNQS